MIRTEKEIKKESKVRGGPWHSKTCGYPSEPCSCEISNKERCRKTHEKWCGYPSEPCSCGLY